MTDTTVLIAGGGIGGMALALTLQQIGVPCQVVESVQELRPLGVGINVQPNAVRELYDLGITNADLDQVGISAKEWALVGLNGNDIYSEPRGIDAGYKWPQYSVHRGKLQMMLYQKVLERLGPDAVILGQRVVGYENLADGTVRVDMQDAEGRASEKFCRVLVGADGIHSAVRAQMHPEQPPIHWGGAIMWRGTSRVKPIRTTASFVGLGTHRHRLVFYPITPADPETGLAEVNWIAEVTVDADKGWASSDWNRKVSHDEFVHHFENWTYDWLDVPAMLRAAETVYEYPMTDRDPVKTWQDQNVILMGDAAHAMYPTGSNGASQAIVDARVLGACFVDQGVTTEALTQFDQTLCGPVSELVLRNRGAGPFGILNIVDERCGGEFDKIEDVVDPQELTEFMAGYKSAAGLAIDALNSKPNTIADGAKVDLSR